MKIVGFSQLHNELEKGNLENWFKSMSFCDYIYIYDQNSTDGSKDYYKKFDNVVVIESPVNDFSREIDCKRNLLEKLLSDHPDTDWIFWMDGDTILEGGFENRERIEQHLAIWGTHCDGVRMGHYNLWRSDVYYRTDNSYHNLHYNGVVCWWKNNGSLSFPSGRGLHKNQFPNGMNNIKRSDYSLIHRGFATDYQIITKYNIYKERGQRGWALNRLLEESHLTVEELPKEMLPEWFELKDTENPIGKTKIKSKYENR